MAAGDNVEWESDGKLIWYKPFLEVCDCFEWEISRRFLRELSAVFGVKHQINFRNVIGFEISSSAFLKRNTTHGGDKGLVNGVRHESVLLIYEPWAACCMGDPFLRGLSRLRIDRGRSTNSSGELESCQRQSGELENTRSRRRRETPLKPSPDIHQGVVFLLS